MNKIKETSNGYILVEFVKNDLGSSPIVFEEKHKFGMVTSVSSTSNLKVGQVVVLSEFALFEEIMIDEKMYHFTKEESVLAPI